LASPRNAQGKAADMARNDRRERMEDGMAQILRWWGKWDGQFCGAAKG